MKPHRRQFRNYLLHKRFQLKYSAWLAGVALLLSVSLGALLTRTTGELVEQTKNTVRQGEQVVVTGRELASESRKVSAVVRMNIVHVPEYADNPELAAAFTKDADAQEARIRSQQLAVERQWSNLKAQAEVLTAQKQRALGYVFGVLALLVVSISVIGIIVTHRVAGPLFKMKRQLSTLAAGKYPFLAPLRKGDDLWDFFEVMTQAVKGLRSRDEKEVETLGAALSALGDSNPEVSTALRALKDEKLARLTDDGR